MTASLYHSGLCLCLLSVRSPLCLIRTWVIGFKVHSGNPGSSLHLGILKCIFRRPLFQIKPHSQVPGTYHFRGHHLVLYSEHELLLLLFSYCFFQLLPLACLGVRRGWSGNVILISKFQLPLVSPILFKPSPGWGRKFCF